jgi:hypothetical protein
MAAFPLSFGKAALKAVTVSMGVGSFSSFALPDVVQV